MAQAQHQEGGIRLMTESHPFSIGIDPGIAGGIALLTGSTIEVHDIPTIAGEIARTIGELKRMSSSHGRTRMIVFPLRRSVELKAATASSRVETLPMFVRSRPSRARRTISLSWARSGTT